MDAEKIEAILPCGSGINHDWEINTKGNRLYVYNAWDYIDENDFYDDVFPFVICFENGKFKYLHFLGCTRSQYRKIGYDGLRDYLEEMFIGIEDKVKELL